MELSDVNPLIARVSESLKTNYSFLNSWKVEFDHAKRRAGVCRPQQKLIGISKYHCITNPEDVVLDTILHEFAHAIAYELHGELGHGRLWKQIAREIGATPRATGRFNGPESPWTLVRACFDHQILEVLGPRFRRNKKIRNYHMKGRPDTQGQLYYVASESLALFEEKKLAFEQLELTQ